MSEAIDFENAKAEREADAIIERARVKPAEQIAEALMEADGIPREVVTELNRLMDLTDEDLFGGAA